MNELSNPEFQDRPRELLNEIVRLHSARQEPELMHLVNQHLSMIKTHFKIWAAVPDDIRALPLEKGEPFAMAIIWLAEGFQDMGDSSFMEILQGVHTTNPIEIWQQSIARAAKLAQTGQTEEGKKILLSLIPELEQSYGNARQALLPKVYAALGVISYLQRDIQGAVEHHVKAVNLCKEGDDLEGFIVYSGILIDIIDDPNVAGSDIPQLLSRLVKDRIDTLRHLGRVDEADEYAEKFDV